MILFLGASALVKRYVAEAGSAEVGAAISQAALTGTTLISRDRGAATERSRVLSDSVSALVICQLATRRHTQTPAIRAQLCPSPPSQHHHEYDQHRGDQGIHYYQHPDERTRVVNI